MLEREQTDEKPVNLALLLLPLRCNKLPAPSWFWRENHDDGAAFVWKKAGYITYMRTDSTNLSQDAVNMVRGYISDNFGKKYLRKVRISTPAKKTHRKRTKRFVLLTSMCDGGIVEGYGSECAETVPVNLASVRSLPDDPSEI
ncbi:hypothetical protein [Klebsiella pneumoniae]|uniref:hypothetical protein n=1 Tax=Klebsiella pneumoniae TaxID=573 RepID=UPI00388F734D